MTQPAGVIFLVGGARSGKSTLAVELGARHAAAGGDVVFVATAPRIDGDVDLDERIRRHQAERPAWPTIEEPLDPGSVIAALPSSPAPMVIVDCITLWVANLMFTERSDDEIVAAAERFAASAAAHAAPTVVIGNEVGLGVHPETELGRRYRDVLGHVNQRLAAAADTTLLLVAGRAVRLDDPLVLLGAGGR